jgi:thiamine-phosphate pyrophosphorylase
LLPAPETPIVCYVTDRSAFAPDESAQKLRGRIRSAAASGVDWIQIREKDLPSELLLGLVRDAVDICRTWGARTIVNDRLDVAGAAGADGVHLGQASLPAREVIRWCRSGNAPKEFLVGVSCHSLEEAQEAEAAGASYVFFGPVFDTPSKREFGAPHGAAMLRELCRALRIPVIAIGGVHAQNASECIRAGAAGVASIREFQDATDVTRARGFIQAVRVRT